MDTAKLVVQWVVGLVILNVWLLRRQQPTPYRGGDAKKMQEEFAVYGLPVWFMWTIGVAKVTLALALIAGTWRHELVRPAAVAMAALMTAAAAMHFKVKDPIAKTVPALVMLGLCAFVATA